MFTLVLFHFMKHASLTPWFTTCAFSTVNSWRIFPNWDRILWERVGTLVTRWFWEHLVNATVLSFKIEIDRGALLEKNTNAIFVQRVTGTTFEISLITKTKWNSVFCHWLKLAFSSCTRILKCPSHFMIYKKQQNWMWRRTINKKWW